MRRIDWLNFATFPFAIIVALGFDGADAQGQVPDLPGWELVWNDEFEGPTVDTTAWELLDRKNSFNDERQYYLPEQNSIDSGNLRITATDEPLDGKLYRSGRMESWQSWNYGRFEARANLPTTQGMWPAIWLRTRRAPWPSGGEIDIMENRGSEPFKTSSAYHWGSSVSAHQFRSSPYTAIDGGSPVNFHDGFHTYAAEWEPGVVRYYVDDHLHFTVTDSTAPIHPASKSLVLNLAVGGHFGGNPNSTTVFPQHLDIDYVRVWQRPGAIPVFTINSGFETQYDAWTRFGNTGNNVVTSTSVASEGFRSLKISGQFSSGSNWSGAYQSIAITGGTKLQANVESLVRSSDSIVGTDNEAMFKLEYYSVFGASRGSSHFLNELEILLEDGGSVEDVWTHHQILDEAPLGAVEARMTLMYKQTDQGGGSVFFDRVLLEALPTADFDLSGHVDGSDLENWKNDFGSGGSDVDYDGDTDGADFLAWQRQFDGAAAVTTVPEPSTNLLMAAMILCGLGLRQPLFRGIDAC